MRETHEIKVQKREQRVGFLPLRQTVLKANAALRDSAQVLHFFLRLYIATEYGMVPSDNEQLPFLRREN